MLTLLSPSTICFSHITMFNYEDKMDIVKYVTIVSFIRGVTRMLQGCKATHRWCPVSRARRRRPWCRCQAPAYSWSWCSSRPRTLRPPGTRGPRRLLGGRDTWAVPRSHHGTRLCSCRPPRCRLRRSASSAHSSCSCSSSGPRARLADTPSATYSPLACQVLQATILKESWLCV